MVSQPFDVSDDGSVVLRLHVHPGAGRTTVVGRHGDALKVKVAAPPEQGRANDACAELVADLAGVEAGAVELTGGASSRSKRFRVSGVDPDELGRRLDQAVEDAQGNAPGRPGVRKSPRSR